MICHESTNSNTAGGSLPPAKKPTEEEEDGKEDNGAIYRLTLCSTTTLRRNMAPSMSSYSSHIQSFSSQ